ncbi:MAG: phosphoribosyltransferase family protein [Patescibacteria group bacterium]
MEFLKGVGAVITDTHVVYTSGLHGIMYVNKDALYPQPKATWEICREIAADFVEDDIEAVVGPAVGGVILSHVVAHILTNLTGRRVCGVYAERAESSILTPKESGYCTINGSPVTLHPGDEVVVKRSHFVIKRGQDKHVAGRRVLGVEDVLTTGGSAKRALDAARACGGNVVGLSVINSGGMTAGEMGVPKLAGVINYKLTTWTAEECKASGPCAHGVPVNTAVGHGAQFLATKT